MAACTALAGIGRETQLCHLLDKFPAAAFTCDVQGRFTSYNSRAAQLWCREPKLGEPVEQFFGSFSPRLHGGGATPQAETGVTTALRTGRDANGQEFVLERPDGRRVSVMTFASPMHDDAGQLTGAVVVLMDVTEQRLGEERERARAAEMAAIIEAVPAVVFIAEDPECRVIRGNRIGYETLRLSPGANLSKSAPAGEAPTHFRVFRDGQEVPADQLPVQRAARGHHVRDDEFEVVFSDGTRRFFVGNAVPLHGPEGAVRGAVSVFVDITERKQMETSLRVHEDQLRGQNEALRLLSTM